MSVKKTYFPHPVLESQFIDSDTNFKGSYFKTSINDQLLEGGSDLTLETIFELENEVLNEFISNGKAIFALLIICESTVTRIFKKTQRKEEKFNLPTRLLNKTVVIYPLILSNEDISEYRNTDLVEPLNNLSFEVLKGDKLAISNSYELYIEKEPLIEVESIFEFIELRKKNAPLLSFNPNSSKIQIYLPTKTYLKVTQYSNYPGGVNNILISLFYTPAVVHALRSVVSLKQESDWETQLLEYKDYSWYRTLEFKFEKLKLGNDLSEIGEDNITDIACRLMEDPNNKALDAIEELFFSMEGTE